MLYFKDPIPEDWQIESIVNLIENYQQGFASGARDKDGILQLRMNNITTEGRILLDSYLKVPIPDNIDIYLLKKDDVIFNNTNSVKLIGKTAIFNNECNYCTFSNHLTRLRVDKSKVFPHWLLYHFNQAWRKYYFRRICNAHVNQAGIKREDIEHFKIPLPQQHEQRIIVSILNNVQDLIGKIEIIIDKLQLLKKGLMQRLFTKGIGHTEFKETRLGKIPKEWKIDQIVNKCEKIYAGGTPLRKKKEYYQNGTIPWIKSGEINNSQIFETEEKINNLGIKNSSAKIFPAKTIIFALYGATAGRVAFIEKPMASNQACLGLICNYDLYYLYLFYYFQYRYKYILSQRIGGAQPNLSAQLVKKLRIIIPFISEQKEIVNLLKTIDNKINNENDLTNALKKIKKGLMQDLLTGKRRVKIN